ncbi:aldehyde ferredoxin oxidoreductase N-terminal domain-containing protein [candidate division CSSED10-310 bacterium]|uniref:Aldehyde ferredoxin oxidoreductase N-terminal domain-containing protein n=1 Tax=candidate division CSSED10-310 bacterium TaxID=2855610 RepID=A0ABV6YTZ4_UNCC1
MFHDQNLTKVLYIDLSKKRFKIEQRPELFERYIGGTGVATQLLQEECPPDCDPLSSKNPIIMSVGPLSALFPIASKTVAMFKSPHTGNLGESHCGGRSAIALRLAGYGALVIKGASDSPIYVAIHGNQIHFKDASTIWGMRSNFTAGRIIRDHEPGAGCRTIMRIGRGGENCVSYACVTTETYRHFGRLGLGAVFGSKKLKALVISGRQSIPVQNRKSYRTVYDEIYKTAVNSPVMKKYHDLGTAENVLPLNAMGGLPTKNLQQARFEKAAEISGERFAQDYLGRRLACAHCPVGCIHIAAFRELYENEPYFYKTSMICYDYEPIYALGSMLGGADVPGFLKLMDEIEIVGLDVMSVGVILAWATEAFEQGLISVKETAGLKLCWGDYETYLKIIPLLIDQPNEFYQALARGVDAAASKYGGRNFALTFGGNEMPGYHTGPGAHLGFLIGTRHSHLDNAGYSIDQKVLTKKDISPAELVDSLISEEQWRQILSSLVICFFARGIYKPDIVLEALRVAGLDLTTDQLNQIGQDIYSAKYKFKIRHGFDFENLHIPQRIFETPSLNGIVDESFFRQAVVYAQKKIGTLIE